MTLAAIGTGGTVTNDKTSTASWDNTKLAASVGDLMVVVVATDNTATTDGETSLHSSIEVGTNTFVKHAEFTNSQGGAGNGATVSVWTCEVSQTISSGATGMVFNFASAVTAKAAVRKLFSRDTSKTIQVESYTTLATDGGAPASMALSSLTSREYLFVRGVASEDNEAALTAASTDYTLMATAGGNTTGGGAATNMAVAAEWDIATATGTTSAPTGPANDNASILVALYEATTGANLQPSLLTNNQTFHAPTVSPGAVTLTPSLFTNSQTFYSPTVAFPPQELTPSLFTNSQSFFAPTVAPGAVTLTPSLFTNSQTFFGPTVSQPVQELTPSLFTNTQTFHAPTVVATYGLSSSLFSNSQSFFAPAVAAAYALTPGLFSNSQNFLSATVLASYGLSPSLFTNAQSFHGPTAQQVTSISIPLITNEKRLYPMTVWADTADTTPTWTPV